MKRRDVLWILSVVWLWIMLATPLLVVAQNTVLTARRLLFTVDARTIADNGGGTAATLTLTPSGSYVALTCNDTNGCTITMGETGVTDGYILTIVNTTANASGFSDSSGVLELAGGAAASLIQWGSLELIYVTDRWVERNRS